MGHKADKILTENNKAIGVEYHKKSSPDSAVKIFGNEIIANAAVPNVVNDLLPEELTVHKTKINKMEIACSILSVYLFFKKTIKEMGNKHYSTFVFNPGVGDDMHGLNYHVDFKERGFVFVDYSQ